MSREQDARGSLPPEGTVLGGRWRLSRLIAVGGMGAVYAARDRGEGPDCALKLLHPDLTSDPDLRRRFRREASILSAIDHPAVVRVLEVDEADGRLFMVMEHVDGETLEQRLARSVRLDAPTLAPLVVGIASGLAAAHERGVIHGDLKPANIFVLPVSAGHPLASPVKIVDFGLSKVLGLERLTHTGELSGTPAFMAPELLTGKGEVDARIDIYAFGVLLYRCLAGRPPFEGKVPGQLMMDVVMGNAPPLRDVASETPEAVCDVVAHAMSRRREDRFENVGALAEAFTHAARSR